MAFVDEAALRAFKYAEIRRLEEIEKQRGSMPTEEEVRQAVDNVKAFIARSR